MGKRRLDGLYVPAGRKSSIEITLSSYLPSLNSQLQCTRGDWENLFHIEYSARNGRIVENRDTVEFGNGSFKQIQLLTA